MCIGSKSKIHLDIKLCYAHYEAVHILYEPLPLSIWMKQLTPYIPNTMHCKTQIALRFWNIFKFMLPHNCDNENS